MISRVGFHPDAKREMREAADFYDLERLGLGAEFLDTDEVTMRQVIEHPESSPVVLGLGAQVQSDPIPLLSRLLCARRRNLRVGGRTRQPPAVLLAKQAVDS